MTVAVKMARCAIYTRKSTDHNLDLEFNSLDAQREACEAYIKSQAHEGWRLVPASFDDGGISGASLERPALQSLLVEIQVGRVDIVVVYKVDRLTRSLTDFAKLVESFDRHGVSFVSITQSFNTTTSMGRLTLNVLLSFAQFEREVIGERVRDKIAASKRKGIWVGGPVPLGYASVNKKIVVVPKEAETVREIFRRYLHLGAVRALAADLDRNDIRSKRRDLANGQKIGGGRLGVGALSHLLKNRFYISEISYRGEIHLAEHESILSREIFEQVQAKLAGNNIERKLTSKGTSAILSGRLYDDLGNKMTPSHTSKKGVRYRYYVSNAILQNRKADIGAVRRVPAPELEELVIREVMRHCEREDGSGKLSHDDFLTKVERVVLTTNAVSVHLRTDETADGENMQSVILSASWKIPTPVAVKGVIEARAGEVPLPLGSENREGILTAIAKAQSWIEELVSGRTATIADIAEREGKVERYIRLLISLAFVPPKTVEAIIDGSTSEHLTVTGLAKSVPLSWSSPVNEWIIRGS